MAKLAPPMLRRSLSDSSDTGLPSWAVPASLALALAGLGVSIYLTVEHFTAPGTAACPAGATVNCAQVTTSAQSTFIGIPVAVLGTVYFAAMLALCLPPMWRISDAARVWKTRMAAAGVGLLFAIWLIFAEIFLIEAICLWCTAVHLLAFGLFAVIVMATVRSDLPDRQ